MASIDEILDASDSDDCDSFDVATDYDLERILLLDDDESDDVGSLSASRSKINYYSGIPANPFLERVDAVDNSALLSHVNQVDLSRQSNDQELEQIVNETDIEVVDGGLHSGNCDFGTSEVVELTLLNADARERRYFYSEIVPVVSALRAKRATSSFAKNSNIKVSMLDSVSAQLCRNSSYKSHGPGIASAISANSKLIAFGTTKGFIVLFDRHQEMRQVFGSTSTGNGDKSAAVTSIDISSRCQLLISGNASGRITIWDVEKGSELRTISDLHNSPVICVRFVSSISQNFTVDSSGRWLPTGRHPAEVDTSYAKPVASTQLGFLNVAYPSITGVASSISSVVAISADSSGVLHKLAFNRSAWSSCTVESDCLLDGSSGPISGTAVLSPLISHSGPQKCIEQLVGTSFLQAAGSSHFFAMNVGSYTWIIQLSPAIKVIHKWRAPKLSHNERNSHTRSLDWGWCKTQNASPNEDLVGAVEWRPVLARTWGKTVELLEMRESTNSHDTSQLDGRANASSMPFGFMQHSSSHLPADVKKQSFQFNQIGVADVGNEDFQAIKWLNSEQLVLLSHTGVLLVLNKQLQRTDKSRLPDIDSPSDAAGGGFHPEICSSESTIFVHRASCIHQIEVQSCFEMADDLVSNGQWLDALATVLESARSFPRMKKLRRSEVCQYILKYVELAVKQPAIASISATTRNRNHFHLVAGVCIEYCIGVQELDMLFDQIFNIFTTAHQQEIYLESLEPYILNLEIKVLPSRVLIQFCECLRKAQRISALERCFACFDLKRMDVQFAVHFLFDQRMHSMFLYSYSTGLSDYAGALNVCFHSMVQSMNCTQSAVVGQKGGTMGDGNQLIESVGNEHASIAYKLLLFLLHTFQRNVFPFGRHDASAISCASHWHLLRLLCSEHHQLLPTDFHDKGTGAMLEGVRYPYLSILSDFDCAAVLYCAEKGLKPLQQLVSKVTNFSFDQIEQNDMIFLETELSSTATPAVADLESGISEIYDSLYFFCEDFDRSHCKGHRNSSLAKQFFTKFLGLIADCPVRLSSGFLGQLIAHCTNCPNEQRSTLENGLKDVAQMQSRFTFDTNKFKEQLCAGNFWIASLMVKRGSALASSSSAQNALARYKPALHFYIALSVDERQVVGSQEDAVTGEKRYSVFEYISREYDQITLVVDDSARELLTESLSHEVIACVSQLFAIDSVQCKAIVCSHLLRYVPALIECTRHDIMMQFELLHCIVQSYGKESLSAAAKTSVPTEELMLGDIFTPECLLSYFTLLCTYSPESVLSFLKEQDNKYPVDDCLRVCREHSISEATAYLMEKIGDADEALRLLLIDISIRLKGARKDIDGHLRCDSQRGGYEEKEKQSLVLQILSRQGNERNELISCLPMYSTLSNIVHCAADLCSRQNEPGESENMWFQTFDHLLLERHCVRSGTVSSSGELIIGIVGLMLHTLMSRMKGSIAAQDIIRRVTLQGNASGMRLGELKDVLLNMITANSQDLLLYQSINHVFNDDLVSLHRKKIQLLRKYCQKGSSVSERTDSRSAGSENTEEQDLILQLNSINTDADLTQVKVSAVPWNKPDIKENYKKWKQAISRNNVVAIRTTLPTDTSDILFQDDYAAEARRPGLLNARAVYQAALDFRIDE